MRFAEAPSCGLQCLIWQELRGPGTSDSKLETPDSRLLHDALGFRRIQDLPRLSNSVIVGIDPNQYSALFNFFVVKPRFTLGDPKSDQGSSQASGCCAGA